VKVKVNTTRDLVLGISFHYGPVAPLGPHLSLEGALQKWLGFYLHQNKFTTTVRHRRRHIALKDHNIGLMMPHLTITLPSNPWYLKIWPLSSCEIKFSSSKVRANGEPIGCASVLPFLPMMTCGEPFSLPLGLAVWAQLFNNVRVSLNWRDLLAGILSIVLDIAIEFIFGYFSAKGSVKPDMRRYPDSIRTLLFHSDKKWTNLSKLLLKEATAEVVDTERLGQWVVKKAAMTAAGFAVSQVKGQPEAEVETGLPFARAKVGAARDQGDGGWKPEAEVVVGPGKFTFDHIGIPGLEFPKIVLGD